MSNVVTLELQAKDSATATITHVMSSLRSQLAALLAPLAAVSGAAGFGALIKQGVEFNKTMEDSRAGIASLILANNQLLDSHGRALGGAQALAKAFAIADGVQADLRKSALTTAASYQELVKGFQTAYGPATAAGITSLSKIKEITVSASQAVAALGLDSRQTSQELRALFSGDQGPDNILVRTLGITKAEMDRVRASGEDLGDFLIAKLKPFADVAGKSMGNFSTVLSNVGDVMDQVMGEAMGPLFREIKALASGLGGTAEGLSGGLGAIGQGLADALRAVGPLLQSLAELGVAAAKAGTDFLAAFAPVVPALTAVTRAVTATIDSLGPLGVAALAGGFAFGKLGSLANSALYGLIGASAATDTAIAALIGTVSLATVGWVALGAAIAAAVGWLIKWNFESKADDAWKRAATAQQTFIETLERRYHKTVEIAASEELLNMAQSQRALVMDRVLKLDKDGVITLDEVKSALAAMTEETMKARNAAAGFANLQEKTKEKYADLLAALKAEIRIGSLEGLKKDLAMVGEEFRKKRDEIRKTFFDPGTGQWAQNPNALLDLLGIRETQQLQEKARDFAKAFKAVPEEISGAWTGGMKKVEQIIDYTFTEAMKTGRAAVEDFISIFNVKLTKDNVLLGVSEGWHQAMESIPGAALSAANAVRDVWSSMARTFDDVFYNVLSGRLDSLKDVFRNLWDSLLQIFSRFLSDMVQRWIKSQIEMSQTGYTGKAFNVRSYGPNGEVTTATGTGTTSGAKPGVMGYVGAAGAGWGFGSSIGAGGIGNQVGGAVGAVGGLFAGTAITTALTTAGTIAAGSAIGSVIPVLGTIVGALIGAIIGGLFNKSTERSTSGSIGNMWTSSRQVWAPGTRDPETGERTPGSWQTVTTGPKTAFERAGQDILQAQAAAFSDLFKLGAKDQAKELYAAYTTALRETLSGGNFKIMAGSQEDIEKDAEYLLKSVLPRIGLSAAFGQKGYLPTGYRDKPGGIPGINYGLPGMDESGQWIEKQLFDPEAPIPKMLSGLGFTNEAIEGLAKRISTDDPEKLLTYIQGIVGVVVGLGDLRAEMGKTFDELVKGWKDESAGGPAAAFGKAAKDLAGQFGDLSLYSGDEQLKKAQEAQAAASQFWESVKSYLQQLQALGEKLSAGLQGAREKMRAFLNPLSESGQTAADQGIVDSTWGKLLNATTPAEIETATNEAAAAIERMFSVLAERVTRGKALIEKTWDLLDKLGNLEKDVAFDQLLKDDPLKAWGRQVEDVQAQIARASAMSGLEQITAMEGVNASAETMYQNLRGFLSDIANVAASINKSIDSQIWELGVGEMDPAGQAGAITQRIQQLQEELKAATSPAEIAAITSEIQSLTSRYVGTFGKDDPNRQAAIDWAREELERTKGIANEALGLLHDQAQAFADELETMLRGSTTVLTSNVDDATTAIGQLSHTLGALDTAVQEAIGRLGTAALDSLEPLRAAMDGAAEIFKGATTAAGTALTAPESGFTAATERSTASVNAFSNALDRLTAKVNGASGDGTAAQTKEASVQVVALTQRVTAAEIVAAVRRNRGRLEPLVG